MSVGSQNTSRASSREVLFTFVNAGVMSAECFEWCKEWLHDVELQCQDFREMEPLVKARVLMCLYDGFAYIERLCANARKGTEWCRTFIEHYKDLETLIEEYNVESILAMLSTAAPVLRGPVAQFAIVRRVLQRYVAALENVLKKIERGTSKEELDLLRKKTEDKINTAFKKFGRALEKTEELASQSAQIMTVLHNFTSMIASSLNIALEQTR